MIEQWFRDDMPPPDGVSWLVHALADHGVATVCVAGAVLLVVAAVATAVARPR